MVWKKMHILLVEDSEFHGELIREALFGWNAAARVTHVKSLAGARSFLDETTPHLVLLDYKLPDGLGTELLRDREQDACPFVVLTGSGDEQSAVDAMRSGALDYLVKSSETLESLPQVVKRSLREWDHIRRRRQAEEALRFSEEKYRSLFDNMSEAVAIDQLVLDAAGRAVDWRVLDINPAYEQIYGIARQKAIGQLASELYAEKFDIEPIIRAAADALDKDRSRQVEFDYYGSDRYLLVSIFPISEGRFATLGRDITKRRRMEEALRKSEERLRLALDVGGMGVWEWDMQQDEVHWDAGQRRIFRLPADEEPLSREQLWQMFHPEDRERASIMTRRALEKGELRDEIRILRGDGTAGWIASSGKVLKDAEGRPVRMLGVNFDITERKCNEVERELLVAELDATINAIADAVIIYGPNGEIRRMNPAAEKKFGYSEEDRKIPLAERLAEFEAETPDGKPFPILETMQKVIEGERMEGVLVVLRHPEGRELWLSNSAAPILTTDGKQVGAVGTATDITELHRLQEERDQYLHTISHDLRIPLTVIRGYAQLLEEFLAGEKRDDQVPLMLSELSGGVRRMSRMIDDLVEMARLEGGKIAVVPACIPLHLLVEGLRQRPMESFDWKDVQVEIPEDLPPVETDADHLERILMNLLTNARKYSPPGSPIRLVASRQPSQILVSVIDRGCGIDPRDQPHIFERFYRTNAASRRDSVGLGLYITRKLVEANGGRIRVESVPGEGSTFTFTLSTA